MVLQSGKAPNIDLPDKNGVEHNLKSIDASYFVIYFYPRDNTPGCTIEAIDFSEDLKKYNALKTVVIGISGGDETTKTKFCDKYNLKVLLLSDSNFAVSKAYGVYGSKKFIGRIFKGITRTTFILNKDKEIIHVFKNVKAKGHSEEVLKYLKTL
tara:strand:- start:749 stop:1210 length:462 start_codon:yes stop_codon:yes gene_type:complete